MKFDDDGLREVVVIKNEGTDWFNCQVWADDGLKEVIQSVPGVVSIIDYPGVYWVTISRRYDPFVVRGIIKQAIEEATSEDNQV